MAMKLKIMQFFTVMLAALVAGVFWGTWFSLSRSISAVTPETFLEIGKTIINNLAVPMRILMPGSILLSVVTLIFISNKKSTAFYYTVTGAFLMIISMIITLSVNVPIDNQIKVWTLNSMPSNWGQIRDHWENFHVLRTFVSIAGLAAVLLGTLTSK
jgi:uncharacterized membrane protein